MQKDFDGWNVKKRITHGRPEIIGVHERDIWWVSFGINIGVETDGKHGNYERPALVVRKFNNQMLWVLPITSQNKTSDFHEKVIFDSKEYFVALTQLRTVSTKRLLRKEGMLPLAHFNRILERLRTFLVSYTKKDPLEVGL